jgi:hypothetical protein
MALVKCKKHGGAGLRELCGCLDQAITQGLFPKTYELTDLEVVCQSCAEFICKNYSPTNITLDTLHSVDVEIELSKENWVLFYNKHNQTSVCWCELCYQDFKVKRARYEDKPIAFDVYEKTLEYQDKAIIDKLYEYLLGAYPFKLKLYDDDYRYSYSLPNTKGIKALEVHYGYILRPLTISVWYVTEKEQQKLVLNIIEQFFKQEQEEKYQRKVIFYEAETPRIEIENEAEGWGYTTKEDEVVLLEILTV